MPTPFWKTTSATEALQAYRCHRGATSSVSVGRAKTRFRRIGYFELAYPGSSVLPTSSSHEPTHIIHESSSSCHATALPGEKKSPFKNRPPWSRYLPKPHGSPIEPPSEPPSYGRRADPDNAEPILTTSESAPRDSRALVIEQPKNSPEIPETPTVALEIMRRDRDDNSEDGNTPSHVYRRWSTATNRT